MFDIGWSEILVIAVVAIVVVGPKDLPPMLRAAGRMVSKARRTAGEFQAQFNEALREAELDGVQDSINELRGLNPLNDIKKSLDPVATALARPESAPKLPPVAPPPAPAAPVATEIAAPAVEVVEAVPTVPVTAAPLAAPAIAVVETAEAAPVKRTRRAKPKADAVANGAPVSGDGEAVAAKPARKRASKVTSEGAAESAATASGEPSIAPAPKKPRASRAKPKLVEAATPPVVDGLPNGATLAVTPPPSRPAETAPKADDIKADDTQAAVASTALPPASTSEERS